MKKVLISLVVAVIALYPLFTPVVYAVDSWSGNPWTGDPWEGAPWDGSNLEWQGDPWQGEGTQGDHWEGNPTQGIPPNQWQSLPWQLEGWGAEGFTGEYWTQEGFIGEGITGNPWSQNGFNGNGTLGSPWANSGFYGNGFVGSPFLNNGFNGNGTLGSYWMQPGFSGSSSSYAVTSGSSWHDQFIDVISSDGYKTSEYIFKGVVMGKANLIGDFLTHQKMQDLGFDSKFGLSSVNSLRKNILMNGLKLGIGDDALIDVYDTASNSKALYTGIRDTARAKRYLDTVDSATDAAKSAKNVSQTFDTVNDLANASKNFSKTPPPAAVGALSKLNVAASAAGTVLSGIDTYNKYNTFTDVFGSNAPNSEKVAAGADVGASAGNTIMNAGVVVSAVNPVFGLGIGAAGAGIWLASKATGFVSRNWKGFNTRTLESMGKSIVDSGKKTINKIKGWFS
ncbi:hypothetical protein [Piscibacillus halophilus]|uniref:hypothetical protein n=1 Tax=Piscibacillus halophilus TaxID=571933 RepID=UPI00158DAB70|nr:hypothetical protein [Piscibacillus halophilus]